MGNRRYLPRAMPADTSDRRDGGAADQYELPLEWEWSAPVGRSYLLEELACTSEGRGVAPLPADRPVAVCRL
jgi:hypothetical protein